MTVQVKFKNKNKFEEVTEESAFDLWDEGKIVGVLGEDGIYPPNEILERPSEELETSEKGDWEPVGYFSQSKSGKAYTIKIGDDYYSVYGKALESVVKGKEDTATVVRPSQ